MRRELQLCTVSLQAHGVALFQSMQLSQHHPPSLRWQYHTPDAPLVPPAGHADAAAVQGRPLPVLAPGVAAGAGGPRARPLHPGPGARRQRGPRLRPGGKIQLFKLICLRRRVTKAACCALMGCHHSPSDAAACDRTCRCRVPCATAWGCRTHLHALLRGVDESSLCATRWFRLSADAPVVQRGICAHHHALLK